MSLWKIDELILRMFFKPRFIWGQQGEASYKRRAMGEGYTLRYQKRTRVSCNECGVNMEASSLLHYMEISYGTVTTHIRGVDVSRGGLDIYVVSFPSVLKSVA